MKKLFLAGVVALALAAFPAAAATYSKTATGTVLDLDTRGYAGISLGVGGSASGATVVVEANSDATGGGTWYPIVCTPLDGSAAPTNNPSTVGKGYVCSVPAPRVRLRLTAISSGTYTVSQNFVSLGDVASIMAATAASGSISPVNLQAGTTGGSSGAAPFILAASDNHQALKNGAGTLYYINSSTTGTTANFGRLYDSGTGFNGCNSATNLIWAGQFPAPGMSISFGSAGRAFTNGLSFCGTGANGLTDTTSAVASVTTVNVGFK